MNNEISNSLVAKMPAATSAVSSDRQATEPQTDVQAARDNRGNVLPQAEATDRQNASSPPDRAAMEQAAEELSRRAAEMGRDLRFDVDDDSGVTVIKVIDPITDEVVRQIPSEEALDRAHQRSESGFNLIDDTA